MNTRCMLALLVGLSLVLISQAGERIRCKKIAVDSRLKISVTNAFVQNIIESADDAMRNLTQQEIDLIVSTGREQQIFKSKQLGPGKFKICPPGVPNRKPGCSAVCFSGSSCGCTGSCCRCCCRGTGNGQVAECFNIFTILGLPDPIVPGK